MQIPSSRGRWNQGCTGQMTQFCFFSMHAHIWEVEALSFSRVVLYSPESANKRDAEDVQVW